MITTILLEITATDLTSIISLKELTASGILLIGAYYLYREADKLKTEIKELREKYEKDLKEIHDKYDEELKIIRRENSTLMSQLSTIIAENTIVLKEVNRTLGKNENK